MSNFKTIQCVVQDCDSTRYTVLTFVRNKDGLFTTRLGDNKFVRDVFPRLSTPDCDLSTNEFAERMIAISKEYELIVSNPESYDELIETELNDLMFGYIGDNTNGGIKVIPLVGTSGKTIPLLASCIQSIGTHGSHAATSKSGSPIGESLDSAIQNALNNVNISVTSQDEFVAEFQRVFSSGDHQKYHKCTLLINGEVIYNDIENDAFNLKQEVQELNLANVFGCFGVSFF